MILKNSITLNRLKHAYNLKIKDEFTMILGDSGQGKTYFYTEFKEYCAYHEIPSVFYNIIEHQVDQTKKTNNLLKSIKESSGKIIVIDEADITVDNKTALAIRKDHKNQYIVFGRDTNKFMCRKANIAIFIKRKSRDNQLTKIALYYPLYEEET